MKTPALAPALAVVSGMALAAAGSPAAAQESGTFTLTQNGNQVAAEEFTRTGDRLETELEVTGQGVFVTDASLGEDAKVDRVELRIMPPDNPDADPLQTVAAEFASDSVTVEQPIGTAVGTQAAVDGTVPFLNPSPSYMEQILRRARALGGSQVTVQIWVPRQGAGQVVQAHVEFGDGAATLTLGTAAIELDTDDEGRVLGGEVPGQGLIIERQ